MYKLFPYQQKLVNQARQSLASGNHAVLIQSPAGSGKSVIIAEIAKLAVAKNGHVMFTVHRRELTEQIRKDFEKDEINPSKTTIMTVGKIKNRLGKLPKPSLIITDETHHSLAKTYQKIYKYYADVPRIGFTATPWRMSGKGLHGVYDDMVKGPSVDWLIKHHYLAPFTMYGFEGADRSMLRKSSTGDYTKKSMDTFAKRMIYGDIIKNWKDKANGRKTIVYCHAVWFSQAVADEFNRAGIPAIHVDSKTPASEREHYMKAFKEGKIKVLCNVDLVSEGFNVPDCSCVVMLRPTASLVLYIQQAMRSMRYQPGKHAIIIDQVSNFEKFGLPDADHNWTLDDRQKKRKRHSSGPGIKTCPKCFAVVPSSCTICPICGHEWEVEKSELEIDKSAKLTDVSKFKLTANYIVTKKPSELKTPEELKQYAKAKHYKPGWVYYQMKQRGWVH